MQKFLIFSLLISFSLISKAQTEIDLGFNSKKEFVSIKTLKNGQRKNIEDYFITDNDTLVNLKVDLTTEELKLFCHYYTNDSLVRNYKKAVFYYSWNNDEVQKSNQWNSAITVYFDSTIPRKVRKDFIRFFKPLHVINNLKIDFVKHIEESNYVIRTSDTLIPNLRIGDSKYNEIHPLSKINYSMLTDNTRKFYGGTAIIDLQRLNDKTLLLQKLKQLFFISLGQFIINKTFPETSLLSTNYNNSKTISDEDLELLKMHYFKIFDKPLSAFDINQFVKKSNSFCKNE